MSFSHTAVKFGPPFDDSDADIILRSTGPKPGSTTNCAVATDFLLHKLLLIKASSVFKSLLSKSPFLGPKFLYQENSEDLKLGIKRDLLGDLPVLCLPEDRDTVHRLLTAIYPIDIVLPRTLESKTKTFAAARKYGMPTVLARFQIYCSHVAPVVVAEDAFRAYLSSLNEGLKEEALEAAQLTLSL